MEGAIISVMGSRKQLFCGEILACGQPVIRLSMGKSLVRGKWYFSVYSLIALGFFACPYCNEC